MFSDQNLGLYVGNEKSQINNGVISRKRRNIRNLDPNVLLQKTQSKNESSIENESINKIQKLKEKMNLINESQQLLQDTDIMSTLQIKPIQSNLINLYSPLKLPLKQKSSSQYMKKSDDGFLQSPIDNYILKKLEKIAEGNKDQQCIQQFSPERAQIRQVKKLLPIQSLTRHKNSFFGEMTQQRNSVDFQSEQYRDNVNNLLYNLIFRILQITINNNLINNCHKCITNQNNQVLIDTKVSKVLIYFDNNNLLFIIYYFYNNIFKIHNNQFKQIDFHIIMERKPIGEKLSNISALIQKQQQPKDSQDDQDEMKQYKMIFPNMNKQESQEKNQLKDSDKLQQVQSIIQEQKQFQNDISKLLNRLGKIQEQNPQSNTKTISINQQQSPQSPFEQSQNQTPNNRMTQSVSVLPKQGTPAQPPQPIQLFVQNSPINDQQFRNLKEQNVDLLRQIAQLQPLQQVVNDLKLLLQQCNDRIREQQKQIDIILQENIQLKQQIIIIDQEKVNNKRQFDEIMANTSLIHQRDMQSIRFQAQENLNALESTWKQQYVLLRTENEAIINNLNTKLAITQKDNQSQQDLINNLLVQNKELQQNLQSRITDLGFTQQTLVQKQQEFEQLQYNYNNSLEKYEINTKQMINQNLEKQQQYEKMILELKQHNDILSQQIVELDQTHKQLISNQQLKVQHHINGKLEEVQKMSIIEKQQIQQHYEEKLNKLNSDKESQINQQQQQIIYLEQKLAILIQENKTLVDQLNKVQKKAENLEQIMITQEAAYQNLTKDSQYKTLSMTKQIQDLNSMIGNFNQNYNNQQTSTRRSDNNEFTDKNIQLEQQLAYKKEEMDLLLHHLDQVFEINRDFENKIKTLQAQLELMEEKSNREQDQYNNQIKQLKQQNEELKQRVEVSIQIEQQKDQQIKELQQKLQEEEVLKRKQNDLIQSNEKQQFLEQIKQLKIKNVELINQNEILEQNLKEIKDKYDQSLREQKEQQQRFEEQKLIIEQQIQALQKKNQEQQLPIVNQIKRDFRSNETDKQQTDKDYQIRNLEQKIKEYEKKLKDYELKQRTIDDIQNQNKQMIQHYEIKIKELELRIGTYDDQIKLNNKQNSIQLAKIKNLESQLLTCEDDIQRLSDINQNLENHIAKSSSMKVSSQTNNNTELQKLQEDNLKLQEQLNQIKKEKLKIIQTYDNQISSLQQQNQNNLDQINYLKMENQQNQDNFNDKIQNLEQNIKELQNQINLLKNENQELQIKFDDLNEQNKFLQEQIAKLKKEKAHMTMKLMHSGIANLVSSQVSQVQDKN
ncbi:unnamed protein product [Paramecium pentaurelia]|uniref:Uncharacterized protein n=1 Tax=Paramecium pentaurelia TaxID=43138 RepID=A0A8S1UUM9_9CILI|nr:unnamed protein product [Paramecium pentaurelia]